jgi:hypothetical protein
MSISAGVGLSKKQDSYQAGYEACGLAIERLGEKPHFTVTFASSEYDSFELIHGVRDASNNAPGIGCSTAGEITGDGPSQKSVAVMAIASDQLVFTSGLGPNIKEGPRLAGQAVARDTKNKSLESPRVFIMLPDVLSGNGAETIRGILDIFGQHFPVVGGAAADDFLFKKTYQYQDGEVVSGAVSGAGVSGRFSMGVGVKHGWVPIGHPMKVTRAEGAVVYELDNKPAIGIYEGYFGDKAKDLKDESLARIAITYPLGIKISGLDEYLIRDPISADENGAITCAAEIPVGSEVRLMIGSKERAIEAAKDAARKLMSDFSAQRSRPKFVLMFNCIARKKLFGQKAHEEIDAVMDIIGRDVPLIGFYTYGEQAPMDGEISDPKKIQSKFYNETIVMAGFGE